MTLSISSSRTALFGAATQKAAVLAATLGAGSLLLGAGAAHAALSCATPCTDPTTETATNPFYDVYARCDNGRYTAGTGASHSVTIAGGGPQNVIFGGSSGTPSTSDLMLRVHNLTPEADFTNPGGGETCSFDPPDTAAEPANVGVETEWTLTPDPGMTLTLRHEAVAFGSVESDSGVRLSITVTNDPTSTLTAEVGVRWQIDYQNGGDDGPLYAPITCDPFTVGTELTNETELLPAEILDFYRIQNNTSSPVFGNYSSTTAIAGVPGTGTPDRLVFANFNNAYESAWDMAADPAVSADVDSAVLYWFGALPADALVISPGDSVTRSMVIFTADPSSLDCGNLQPETCLPEEEIECGVPLTGDTNNFGAEVENYSCSNTPQTETEAAYTFSPDASVESVTLDLTDLAGDLNLFVLSDDGTGTCDPSVCTSASEVVGLGDESVTFTPTAGASYFILVDSPSDASSFTLTASCFTPCEDDDDDGVCNEDDVCPDADDNLDSDDDTVPDCIDVCPDGDDTVDVDSDGVPDACDPCPLDFPDDTDDDGVCDSDDQCQGFDDAIDEDGDLAPDGCDACPGFDDRLDEDGDLAPDDCDVCPGFDDRLDEDRDLVPDGCDVCPGFDDAIDENDDGIVDGCEEEPPSLFLQGSGFSCNPASLSAADDPIGPWALALLMAGALGLGQRRRRSESGADAPADGAAGRRPALLAVLGLMVPLALPAPAQAQAQTQLDVQRFDPAAQAGGYALVRDAIQPTVLTLSTFFSFNYAFRPLEAGNPDDFTRSLGLVDHLFGFDLGVTGSFNKWIELGVTVPFVQVQAGDQESFDNAALYGHSGRRAGVGDTTVSVGVSLLRQSDGAPLNLAVVPRLVIPTGRRDMFLGSGAWGVGGDLAIGISIPFFHLSGNIGFQANTSTEKLGNIQADDELRWGIGLGVPLLEGQIEPQLEWVGGTVINPDTLDTNGMTPFDPVHTPSELLIGVRIDPNAAPLWVRAGAGTGVGPGWGTPDFRFFAMVGVDMACDCPDSEPVEATTEYIPDPDPDRDGVEGEADICPHNPEDRDGFEDEDGCPEWDNDGDTVHDATDRCPDEKEVLNGVDDTDGCPDEALALIDVEKQEIVVLDKVYFDLDKDTIKKPSLKVLDAVYTVLNDYPSINGVEIQGHTDDRSSEEYNLDLSRRRANAVMAYLVDQGITADRLTAVGYGESVPIKPEAQTDEEHSLNRRVQFMITQVGKDAPTVKDADKAVPSAPEGDAKE